MNDEILLILLIMIFLHIVDDYYLQGILASMKQKNWWSKNYPDPLYKKDYIVALLMHSFSWSFMINLPWIVYAFIYNNSTIIGPIFYLIISNTIIHAFVDNVKANKLKINLIIDQTVHIFQIICTFAIYNILVQ